MVNKHGMSELISGLLVISSAVLFLGVVYVTFVNVMESNSNKIKSLEIFPEMNKTNETIKCTPNWNCVKISECNADYSFKDVINGIILKEGVQIEKCTDLAKCSSDKFEEKPCSFTIPINSKKVVWCGENYIEIYDNEKNILVGKMKEEKLKNYNNSKIDISFIVTENNQYCDYCYNGIKDYDEIEIDCGGSCKSCLEEYVYSDWLFFTTIILWGILFLLILFNLNPLKFLSFLKEKYSIH